MSQIQLVSRGDLDTFLTGNPSITFFKSVYRKHTNFSIESIEQTLSGPPPPGLKLTAEVARNGDLIHNAYIEIDLKITTTQNTSTIGHNVLYDIMLYLYVYFGNGKGNNSAYS